MADIDQLAGPLPARVGLLNDVAGALTPEAHGAVFTALREASAATGGEIVVTLVKRCPITPSVYAFWLFNRWQLGGQHHTGLLFLVALDERRVECEVGYTWESVLDEEATERLLEDEMLPAFREGDWQRGVLSAIAKVQERLAAKGVAS
ncbi:MAG: TPM domain-containing protein [Myxococcota bacterium]